MENKKTDQEIRMFAVQQVATIYKGSGIAISYEFLPCAELIVEYIKTGKYPIPSFEEEKEEH